MIKSFARAGSYWGVPVECRELGIELGHHTLPAACSSFRVCLPASPPSFSFFLSFSLSFGFRFCPAPVLLLLRQKFQQGEEVRMPLPLLSANWRNIAAVPLIGSWVRERNLLSTPPDQSRSSTNSHLSGVTRGAPDLSAAFTTSVWALGVCKSTSTLDLQVFQARRIVVHDSYAWSVCLLACLIPVSSIDRL